LYLNEKRRRLAAFFCQAPISSELNLASFRVSFALHPEHDLLGTGAPLLDVLFLCPLFIVGLRSIKQEDTLKPLTPPV
jgi:hypothetical protein